MKNSASHMHTQCHNQPWGLAYAFSASHSALNTRTMGKLAVPHIIAPRNTKDITATLIAANTRPGTFSPADHLWPSHTSKYSRMPNAGPARYEVKQYT